jgi:hypothetical protein
LDKHSEARKSHEQKIAKLKEDLAVLEKREAGETQLAADSAAKAAALAFEAAGGNRKALSDQAKHLSEKNEHVLQAQNLEQIAAPIRLQLAAAEADLPRFLLSEQIEAVLERTPELETLSKEISQTIPRIAQAFGEFRKKTLALVSASLPLLGDRADLQRLETSIRLGLNEALRAQLHKDFSAAGFTIFGSLEGRDFDFVMRPRLDNLLHALQSKLATESGVATEGRRVFRATTNIAGLLGRNVRVGEMLSLPTDDEAIRKLIANGALEEIVEKKTRGAA